MVLFVFEDTKGVKYSTFQQNMNKKLLYIVFIDYNDFPEEWKEQIQKDYKLIRERAIKYKITKDVKDLTQKNQKYLHCHRKDSGGGKEGKKKQTKAFGYTPKFVTMIIAEDLKKNGFVNCLQKKGRSLYIDKNVFIPQEVQ